MGLEAQKAAIGNCSVWEEMLSPLKGESNASLALSLKPS